MYPVVLDLLGLLTNQHLSLPPLATPIVLPYLHILDFFLLSVLLTLTHLIFIHLPTLVDYSFFYQMFDQLQPT